MKKISLLMLITTFLFKISTAQMHISTNLREDYTWSTETNSWQLSSEDHSSATLFDFNKEMTMFKHTTETISSAYYIKSKSFDKEKNLTEYEVVSDVGNKYKLFIDTEGNNIRFIGTLRDGSSFLVRHTIKRLWNDED